MEIQRDSNNKESKEKSFSFPFLYKLVISIPRMGICAEYLSLHRITRGRMSLPQVMQKLHITGYKRVTGVRSESSNFNQQNQEYVFKMYRTNHWKFYSLRVGMQPVNHKLRMRLELKTGDTLKALRTDDYKTYVGSTEYVDASDMVVMVRPMTVARK
uniref:Uncharacterized protein n=1 Tax=Coccidioides posadasii RMSCC 3488 TaxID=454284 RepID=A0A0J6FR24_COCPO|nr:hypothetical protein CPAG_08210 [Coccidioides posadasii RMSCC 3488]